MGGTCGSVTRRRLVRGTGVPASIICTSEGARSRIGFPFLSCALSSRVSPAAWPAVGADPVGPAGTGPFCA